ncbi:MAG TPA: HPr family phosphocarrier protein [Candidatus Limnocylindrales bacterium]|nr:HPr family phosphocarrier protein [Candidatus Limnocylindrales bacterium]
MAAGRMADITLTITNEVGLHARPAALFVRAASRYPDTRVEIIKNGRAQNAKSILGVLTLQVTRGTTIQVRADGPHADDVLKSLHDLVVSGFRE